MQWPRLIELAAAVIFSGATAMSDGQQCQQACSSPARNACPSFTGALPFVDNGMTAL